jgi:protein-disulfide isomerase
MRFNAAFRHSPFRWEQTMNSRFKQVLDVLSSVAVIAAAGALLWRLYQAPPPPPGQRPPVETVEGLTIAPEAVSNVRGTGRVVLVEFSDYECPFCARHTQTTAPNIKKELIDSGTLQHVFFNFPLAIHPKAQKAGEAAECAAKQGRFWEMHEQLFENQKALDTPDLLARAEKVGLELEAFRGCLESGMTADKVQADFKEGSRLGVNATPAFFIGTRQPNGSITLVSRINGAVPFDMFKTAVRDALPAQRADAR